MDWRLENKKTLLKARPFAVEELHINRASTNEPLPHPYYRLASNSWVNIFAITSDSKAILVRQPRAGAMADTLETPGGNIDDGEAPEAAARRELEEETGYIVGRIQLLGTINPNPAIMNNKLHMFLAQDCQLAPSRQHFPDDSEEIQIVTVPLSALDAMIQKGELQNALANLTILMAQKYVLKTLGV
ncbi:MAG: NUDIX hydrolase [Chitinophagaceae bacterium]|nr:NUDIX hydrolase [Oligoflexus sp.]